MFICITRVLNTPQILSINNTQKEKRNHLKRIMLSVGEAMHYNRYEVAILKADRKDFGSQIIGAYL